MDLLQNENGYGYENIHEALLGAVRMKKVERVKELIAAGANIECGTPAKLCYRNN